MQIQTDSLNGSADLSKVYQEVIENQHRSNTSTLKGLEMVAKENEMLKR